VLRKAITIVYDDRILLEYAEVLSRPGAPRGDVGGPRRPAVAFTDLGERIESPKAAPFALPDPDDQAFLDVALAAGAEAIITRNHRDFPAACGVITLSPHNIVSRFFPK
jgi:predicted nucleic acid-binding protein